MGTCTGCGLSASSPALDPKLKMLFVSVLSVKGSTIGAVGGEFAALSMGHHGKILWTFPVPSGTESSPVIVGNSVYFGDQGGTEYSLNIKTGHQNWSFPTGGSIKGGAVYYGGNLYFGNYGGSFYAVNAKTGKQVWARARAGSSTRRPPMPSGGSTSATTTAPRTRSSRATARSPGVVPSATTSTPDPRWPIRRAWSDGVHRLLQRPQRRPLRAQCADGARPSGPAT